jgi:CBS domain-containing protein
MQNSERFLNAFGAIEYHLRTMTNLEKRTRFYKLVDRAGEINPLVQRFSDDLKEYADLRNAIVHERSDDHVLAEPNDLTVQQIEYLQSILDNPPTIIPRFQKTVYTTRLEDPIAIAASVMLEHNFSQLPVYDDSGFLVLLTTDDITHWLGRCTPEKSLTPGSTTVAEILACGCIDVVKNYRFFAQDATIFDVQTAFQAGTKYGVPLVAILITAHGREDEPLLGIITIWDVPQISDIAE